MKILSNPMKNNLIAAKTKRRKRKKYNLQYRKLRNLKTNLFNKKTNTLNKQIQGKLM